MSHVCLFDRTKARDLSVFFFLFLLFLFVNCTKKLSNLLCISVSYAFTDVFSADAALATTGVFSVAEAKEDRALIVSSARGRKTRRDDDAL